jgi:hypothetical protein
MFEMDILASKIRMENYKKKRPQRIRECNVCKKQFSSGNRLFRHLDEYPLHQSETAYISYTLKCRNCDYHSVGNGNVLPFHLVPEAHTNISRKCNGIYVDSVEITPNFCIKNRYSIFVFNEKTL